MRDQKQTGFMAIGIGVLLIVMAVIGLSLWLVMRRETAVSTSVSLANKQIQSMQSSNGGATATGSTPAASSVTTLRYTTKTHAVSFVYPANWQVTDKSANGDDIVTVQSPAQLVITLTASGKVQASPASKPTVVLTRIVHNVSLGDPSYLDFVAVPGDTSKTSGFILSKNTTDPYASGFPQNLTVHGETAAPESFTAAQNNADYIAAAKILSSITFQ